MPELPPRTPEPDAPRRAALEFAPNRSVTQRFASGTPATGVPVATEPAHLARDVPVAEPVVASPRSTLVQWAFVAGLAVGASCGMSLGAAFALLR